MAILRRHWDGEGFQGARVESWDRRIGRIVGSEPKVGCCLLVGVVATGRMYSSRDWWLTTDITEIVEDTGDTVVFDTVTGSRYTFTR